MSKKVSSADNQQGTRRQLCSCGRDTSETTRRPPLTEAEIRAYLQGALHDASLNKGRRFRFTQKDRRWLVVLSVLLKDLGYRSWIYREGKGRNVYVLETLAEFLDFRLDPLSLKKRVEQVGYVRGFFDAEGGIPHRRGDRFYIQLVQKDRKKLNALRTILSKLGIENGIVHNPSKKVDPEYWRFFVRTRSQRDFVRIIGSWHPSRVERFRKRMMI